MWFSVWNFIPAISIFNRFRFFPTLSLTLSLSPSLHISHQLFAFLKQTACCCQCCCSFWCDLSGIFTFCEAKPCLGFQFFFLFATVPFLFAPFSYHFPVFRMRLMAVIDSGWWTRKFSVARLSFRCFWFRSVPFGFHFVCSVVQSFVIFVHFRFKYIEQTASIHYRPFAVCFLDVVVEGPHQNRCSFQRNIYCKLKMNNIRMNTMSFPGWQRWQGR